MRLLAILLALLSAETVIGQPVCPDSAHIRTLQDVDVLPRPQNAADFIAALRQGRPSALSDAGVGDTVHVTFVIGKDGVPGEIRVLATPDSGLSAPTMQAVSLLRFTPAQRQGRAVATRVDLPVTPDLDVESAIAPPRTDEGESELVSVEMPRPRNIPAFSRALAQQYPPELRGAGQDAMVHVRFRLEVDGRPGRMDVTCSTHPAFNEPTLAALQVLRFSPARAGTRPVPVWIEMPILWSHPRGPVASPPPLGQNPRASPARGRTRP